jgi:hypothetical protein
VRVALVLVLLLAAVACGGEESDQRAAPRNCLAAWNDEDNPNRDAVPETMGAASVVPAGAGCSYLFHDWGRFVSYRGSWGDDGLVWQPEQRGAWTSKRQRTARDDYVVAADRRLSRLAEASRSWGRGCRAVGQSRGRTYELCRELGPPGPQTIWRNPGTLVVEQDGARRVIHVEPPQRPGNADGHAIVGHWERAILSPDGRRLLLQWSAECETQFTFLVGVEGGAPRPALRAPGAWWDAPSSFAVGWESARIAIVETYGGCGGPPERRRVRVAVDL